MKTKKLFFTLAIFASLCSVIIAQSFSFRKVGNAAIFSYNDLKQIHETDWRRYTANDLYRQYDNLRDSCGNNELLFEQRRETEFANRMIKISGTIKQIRRSILSEYIVELGTTEPWAWDIGVVYPERISQAMINELMTLKAGDRFEALVVTRSTYMYVDVPVWDQNGVYRTEP